MYIPCHKSTMSDHDLIRIINEGVCRMTYNTVYDENWSDQEKIYHLKIIPCYNENVYELPEILPHCEVLCCYINHLTKLPKMPKCKELLCCGNGIIELPELNQCVLLMCNENRLTSLPNLPKCEILDCNDNNLTILPNLPNCIKLDCRNNNLTTLPELPMCQSLYCSGNKLPFYKLIEWQKFWKFKKYYLMIKYFKLFYKKMLLVKAKRKHDLHLELLYSPNLHFYKNDPYYNHFVNEQKRYLRLNSFIYE